MNAHDASHSAFALPVVLGVGVVLRLALAVVNREANDDHLAVVRFIADQGRLPSSSEVWESFQPKLYHVLVAGIWKAFLLESDTARILAGQLVSCAAGIATVIVVLRFLQTQPLTPRVRVLAFALLTWNPGLVAINAQATNDSLLILLGTLALAAGHRFLSHVRTRDWWQMTVAAAAATITKGNGLVLPVAIVTTCALALLRGRGLGSSARRLIARRGALVLPVCFATAFLLGPYRTLNAELGSPFTQPALVFAPWPRLFEKTVHGRPGVRSLAEAFLTFPLADLIEQPMMTVGKELREQSRTSFWAQLYARAHFSRYAACPPSWATYDPAVRWLGSVLMVVALIPTAVLALGFVRQLLALAMALVRGTLAPPVLANALLTITACGFLAMAALYAAKLRDFSGTKEIFVYPAILSFVAFFAWELERLTGAPQRRLAAGVILASGVLLAAGYVVDLVLLIAHLQ